MGKATAKVHVGAVLNHADRAASALRYFDGRILNGFGEFSDPSNAFFYLRDASEAISQALAAYRLAEQAGWTRGDEDE